MSPSSSLPPISQPITVVADNQIRLTDDVLADMPTVDRTIEIVCNSGDRHTETWTGVRIGDVLERVSLPSAATHLLVTAADGYQICVALETARDGVLALVCDGRPIRDDRSYESRFVAADIDGPRTAKDVDRLEAIALDPSTDPTEYETIGAD